jgi:hypothetical protein
MTAQISRNVIYLQEFEETVAERLWGLTEMFPEPVRKASHLTCVSTCAGMCGMYEIRYIVMYRCYFKKFAEFSLNFQ